MKKFLALVLALVMALSLVACGSKKDDTSSTNTSGDTSTGKYKIALSNSYMENGWRQEMEAIAEMVAASDAYKDRVTLDIYNTENTVESQLASLTSLIEMDYDAIIIDCVSETGLNTAIEEAAEKGIVVVTFDSISNSDACYTITIDSASSYTLTATVIAESISGKGNIAVDRGIANTTTSKGIYDACMSVFNSYPDINVVAEFEGEFNEGTEQNEFSTVLATNDLDACFTQAYTTSIINACKDAGVAAMPCNGDSYNCNIKANAEAGVIGAFTPWYVGMSVMAMDTAIDVIEGKSVEKHVIIAPDILVVGDVDVSAKSAELGVGYTVAAEGQDYSNDWPDQFLWPVLPADYPVQVSAADLVAYMASK